VEVTGVNMIDNPAIGGILTTMRDITERRAVEELSPDIFYDIDLQGNLRRVNLSTQKFIGLSGDQLKGRSCLASVYEEDHPIVISDIQKIHTDGSASGIYRFVRHDGAIVPFHCNATLVRNSKGEPTGFTGFGRDISELQEKERLLRAARDTAERAKEALSQALSLSHAVIESTTDGILVVGRSGKISSFNKRFQEIWRIPDEVLAQGDDDKAIEHVLGQLKDPDAFLSKVRELYAKPEDESFDTLEFKDGSVIERNSRPQKIKDEVVGRVWSFRDITARKRAEEALRESEDRLRAITDSSATVIFLKNLAGRYLHVNRRYEELFNPDFPLEPVSNGNH
jgi:PAS domain S-box-containing protein